MKNLLGGILLAIGILIAGASGICSLVVLVSSLGDGSMILTILVIGGIPFLIGLGLFYAGRALIRSGRETGER